MNQINGIWKVNKKRIKKEVLKVMRWNTKEDFLADVLRLGMRDAMNDPKTFIRIVRDEMDPIFVKVKEKETEKAETPKNLWEGWGKAYA